MESEKRPAPRAVALMLPASTYLEEDVFEALRLKAERNERTLSAELRRAARRHVRRELAKAE